MNKNIYYINIETKSILETPFPDSQFEIYASPKDIEKIRSKFKDLKDTSAEALSFLFDPIIANENKVDNKRSVYNDELMDLYAQIYELGSKETRNAMNESGIIDSIKENRN